MNKAGYMVICCFGAMAVIAAPHGHGGPKDRPPAAVRPVPAPHHVAVHGHPRGVFHRRRITIPDTAVPIPMRSIAAGGLMTCGMTSLAIPTIHRRSLLALLPELPLERP